MAASVLLPTEHQETVAVVTWWEHVCGSYGLSRHVLHHSPNEARRSFTCAARLKAEGMRTGWPDLILAVPRGGKGCLFLEMKRQKGGKLTDEQRTVLSVLEGAGNAVAVCKGASEAIMRIEEYLRG